MSYFYLKNKKKFFFLFVLVFQSKLLYSYIPLSVASWYYFYAKKLIYEGKYFDAFSVLDISYQNPKFRKKSLLLKLTIAVQYLDDYNEAINICDKIIKEFPENKNVVKLYKGIILYNSKQFNRSKKIFLELKNSKQYAIRFQAITFLNLLKRKKLKFKKFPKNPEIRVFLFKKKYITICGNLLKINNNNNYSKCVNIFLKNGFFYINYRKIEKDKIFITSKNNIITIRDDNIRKYRGSIELIRKHNYFLVLNLLNIEDYLKGVIPCEIYVDWPEETIKAQIVAARTYALYQFLHRKQQLFDLYSSIKDQMYCGYGYENKRVNELIKITEGEILINDNNPILAMYNANNGGYTESSKNLFNINKKYLLSKFDPYSLNGKEVFWKKKFTISKINTIFEKVGFKNIVDIKPYKKTQSGRIIQVKLITKNGEYIINTWGVVRSLLKLPDILFKIDKKKNFIIFIGKGNGHGIGLSQEGAKVMGKLGWNYKKILRFYYPNTEVKKVW